MQKILILGGGGMVGQKFAALLAETSDIDATVSLFDLGFPASSAPGEQIIGNISSVEDLTPVLAQRFDVIYHLAAIVSGEAETNFDLGWDVNLKAVWALMELIRKENENSRGHYVPKVVFTSSIAVFGGPYPEVIDDDFLSAPQTSYGAQKAMAELLISDYARKGFLDAMSLRLPTICVRPGAANKAASSFFSGIIREPLNGEKANLPVPDTVRHWHASPKSAAGFLRHALTLDSSLLEGRRALNLPGLSCTVAEQIEALRSVAGQRYVDLIEAKPDPDVMAIVRTWPENFSAERALSLGFKSEMSFEQIVTTYIEDDLPGQLP